VNIVARTIWREGRGDGKNGMYAVACVIQKRTLMKSLSAADVCLRRRWDKKASRWTYWFSCWSKATAKDKDYRSLPKTEEARFAQELAKAVVDGEILNHDFVKDADHYCTLDTDPYWADGVEPVAVIGNHKYFKLGQC
jgi:spore germination cell wall hydrolase CwlJ-like protein